MLIHNQGYMQPNKQVSDIINNAANNMVEKFLIKEFETNIGVSGSWNYGTMNMNCPYNIIVNSDVSFAPSTLSKVHDIMEIQRKNCTIVTFGGIFCLTIHYFILNHPNDYRSP